MDTHEKAWQDLGGRLHDYAPADAGDVDADFAALLGELEPAVTAPARRPWWLWWAGVSVVLVLVAGFSFWAGTQSRLEALEETPVASLDAVEGTVSATTTIDPNSTASATVAEASTDLAPAGNSPTQTKNSFGTSTLATSGLAEGSGNQMKAPAPVVSSPVGGFQQSDLTEFSSNAAGSNTTADLSESGTPSSLTPTIEKVDPVGDPERAVPEQLFPGATPPHRAATTGSVDVATATFAFLPPSPVKAFNQDVEIAALSPTPQAPKSFAKTRSNPTISFATGVSTHWRGNGFLRDPDLGFYAGAGVGQRLGRFTLEGQVGYRSYAPNFSVLGEASGEWAKVDHKTVDVVDGEEITYTYSGRVEGYRAIELSLLVHYQVSDRFQVHAGGRYGLPSIDFQEEVLTTPVSHHHLNPYLELPQQRDLIHYEDFSAVGGLRYTLLPNLALETQVNWGFVDLIDDVAAADDRFNHSSSLSLGLRYFVR